MTCLLVSNLETCVLPVGSGVRVYLAPPRPLDQSSVSCRSRQERACLALRAHVLLWPRRGGLPVWRSTELPGSTVGCGWAVCVGRWNSLSDVLDRHTLHLPLMQRDGFQSRLFKLKQWLVSL